MADKTFNCPNCNGHLQADESLVGLTANCPHCQKEITIQFPVNETKTPPLIITATEPIRPVDQKCLKCGLDMPTNARFCTNCGYSLSRPAPAPPQISQTSLLSPSTQSDSLQPALKDCPFCGEQVLKKALKCKHCGSMLDGSGAETQEQTLADVAANLLRGIESVAGRLKITTKKLRFESHAINLQKIPAEISLHEIGSVTKCNTLGIVPNGMLVTLKSGLEYKFVVFGRDKLMQLIMNHLPS